VSWFRHACIAIHGWMPLISLFHLPACSPHCRLRTLHHSQHPPFHLGFLWRISKDKQTTSDNSPNWEIPLIFFLLPHALPDSAHTPLIKLFFSDPPSVLCLHLSPYLQAASHLAVTLLLLTADLCLSLSCWISVQHLIQSITTFCYRDLNMLLGLKELP